MLVLLMLTVGCSGSNEPQSVTDGIDAKAIQDYEAELAKVTGQDISGQGEAEN
jgi:hypothetical protein